MRYILSLVPTRQCFARGPGKLPYFAQSSTQVNFYILSSRSI